MRQHHVELRGAEHHEVALVDEVEIAEGVDGGSAAGCARTASTTVGESDCPEPVVGCTPGPMKRSACSVWPTQ